MQFAAGETLTYTKQDWLAGMEPPKVNIHEPHWYLNIRDDGCALCGYTDSKQRVRMPGAAPEKSEDRWIHQGGDWACGSHFA